MTHDKLYISWPRQGLKKSGKTQKGLARALDLDPMAVSRLLSGKRRFQIDELQKIAAYIDESLPNIGPLSNVSHRVETVRIAGRISMSLWQEGEGDLGTVVAHIDRRFPVADQQAFLIDDTVAAFGLVRGSYVLAVPMKDYAAHAHDGALCVVARKKGALVNYQIGEVGRVTDGDVIGLVIAAVRPML